MDEVTQPAESQESWRCLPGREEEAVHTRRRSLGAASTKGTEAQHKVRLLNCKHLLVTAALGGGGGGGKRWGWSNSQRALQTTKLGPCPRTSLQRRAASFLHGTVESGLGDDKKKRQEDSLGVSGRVHLRNSLRCRCC